MVINVKEQEKTHAETQDNHRTLVLKNRAGSGLNPQHCGRIGTSLWKVFFTGSHTAGGAH